MLRVWTWRITHPRRYWAAVRTHERLTYFIQCEIDMRRWRDKQNNKNNGTH